VRIRKIDIAHLSSPVSNTPEGWWVAVLLPRDNYTGISGDSNLFLYTVPNCPKSEQLTAVRISLNKQGVDDMLRKLTLVALLLCGIAQAQTVDITVMPTSGVESVTPTITWTSTGCTSVTATGSWSGTKSASGSETLPAIDRSASYGLLCRTATGGAVLTWTTPTENTNGTPLTDLAKYRIYSADTEVSLGSAAPVEVNVGTNTYTFDSLPEGTKYFAVTAVNSADIQSVMSNTSSKVITGQSATDEASVTVTPRPKAPAATIQ
jgi:hypothetical protein